MKIGFDSALYMTKQMEHIKERIERYNKLYLEFGGKLFDDYHASRVLPGFQVNAKVKLLEAFKDISEIIICINAADIGSSKMRADFGISYDQDALRLIDNLRKLGLMVSSVVITQYKGQLPADHFCHMLTGRGIKTYLHYPIPGYPLDIDKVVSAEGYGSNPYIETTRPLVVVTAPGPCSGKLATCLSQLYHEYQRGIQAGYAKFETFPIWNIPLKHPVNLAYEAATADLKDVNMIDPFHLDAYNIQTVNYNRDVEVFPIVKTILTRITGSTDVYRSPTDMGVNMAGYGIFDDEVVREAAKQEIVRRYYRTWCDYRQGRVDIDTVHKVEYIMKELDIDLSIRKTVQAAKTKAEKSGSPATAIELEDGTLIAGRDTHLMTSASACVLNAVKHLAGLSDELHLMSPIVLEPILSMKRTVLHSKHPVLNLEEVLLALSICATTNPVAEAVVSKLPELSGCEAHSTQLLDHSDASALRKLGINLTSEPEFPSDDLWGL